ncbi:hypothetical protein JHK87_053077 [Glycine soja]|nr:hypothetical protein JHK87_053077 [Glycine soja]
MLKKLQPVLPLSWRNACPRGMDSQPLLATPEKSYTCFATSTGKMPCYLFCHLSWRNAVPRGMFVLQFSFAEVDWEKLSSGVPLVVRTKGFSPVDNFVLQFSFAEFDREKLRVWDYKFMARVADKIKLIDGSREALKLSIRITDLWYIGIPGKTEQVEMVVIDSDGDEIDVVCKQDQLKSRKADLKENLTYVMHNFKVIKNDGKFRLVVVLDVIGVVDEVVFRYVSSKNTMVVLNLKDLRLWENYCLQFFSYLNDIEDERAIVILLTHARIKEAQGIEVRSILMPIGQGISQVSGLSQLSSKDVFLSKTEVKNISQINASSEEFVCVIVAKITTIVMDNYSWCYLACGQCYKKADMQTVSFTCPSGKENDQPVLRYRVEVMVNHKGEQTKFLIWDREYAQLDGDVDLNASPQALDRLLGCFLAFKVKVQPRFRNSVVLKYSDESDLINVVLDMIPDSEQSLSITADHDGSMLSSSLPTEFESQSVFVTGDHNPLLRIPLTPTKRVSSDELDNEQKNFQISRAEVSSNKLAKHS